MQSVITGNFFQNFQIAHFGVPIGTCMQLLAKPVTVTGTHCGAERHHYAEAQESVRNSAAVPFVTSLLSWPVWHNNNNNNNNNNNQDNVYGAVIMT